MSALTAAQHLLLKSLAITSIAYNKLSAQTRWLVPKLKSRGLVRIEQIGIGIVIADLVKITPEGRIALMNAEVAV